MTSLREQKVVAAYPYPHSISARFHNCWDALRQYDFMHTQRIAVGGGRLANSSGANINNARNEIVQAFLASHTADWLWFIDTDMTFEPDTLDRLVKAAHPVERPIVGGLCFSWQQGNVAAPTLYVFRHDNKVGRMLGYEHDTLIRVLTGTGCLLIHRSALQKIGERNFNPAYRWFQETNVGDLPIGEDLTFCIRAESLGIPVYVHTGIKVGHEKPIVVDESVFDAQQATFAVPPPADPTFVVIPAKDRHEMTRALIGQLVEQVPAEHIFLLDNGSDPSYLDEHIGCTVVDAEGLTISQMWNLGLELAEKKADGENHNVAILNNDLQVPDDFLARLAHGLRLDDSHWISYPNWHSGPATEFPPLTATPTHGGGPTGRSMCGWAFMMRGERGLRFDEQFTWWYGDDDIQRQVEARGGVVVCVGGCYANHLEPNKSTKESPELQRIAAEDMQRFHAKWGGP